MQLHDLPEELLPLIFKHLKNRDSLALAPQVMSSSAHHTGNLALAERIMKSSICILSLLRFTAKRSIPSGLQSMEGSNAK